MTKKITCKVCSYKFKPRKRGANYCSRNCYLTSLKKKFYVNENEKICTGCKKVKNISEYHKQYKNGARLQSRCKECQRERQRRITSIKYICVVCEKERTRKVENFHTERTQEKIRNHRGVCMYCASKKNKEERGGHGASFNGTKNFSGSDFCAWKFSAKRRHHSWEINKEDLEDVFNKQKGVCALSGIKMLCFSNTPFRPSLDRIDSSKGYTKGNIQFVCSILNVMKNKYAEELFFKMCKSVVTFKKL